MKHDMKYVGRAAALLAVIILIICFTCVLRDNAYAAEEKLGSKGKLQVKSVIYKPQERKVRFTFNKKVQYRNLKVKITDGKSRKNLVISLNELNPSRFDAYVRKLKYGREYTYYISGIRKAGTRKYVKLSGKFRALDR